MSDPALAPAPAESAPSAPVASAPDASASGSSRTGHRHHRRHRHFVMQSEAEAKRSEDLRILAWLLPAILLAAGTLLARGILREPEPSLRHAPLLHLGYGMAAVGGILLVAVLVVRCVRAILRASREERERHEERRP